MSFCIRINAREKYQWSTITVGIGDVNVNNVNILSMSIPSSLRLPLQSQPALWSASMASCSSLCCYWCRVWRVRGRNKLLGLSKVTMHKVFTSAVESHWRNESQNLWNVPFTYFCPVLSLACVFWAIFLLVVASFPSDFLTCRIGIEEELDPRDVLSRFRWLCLEFVAWRFHREYSPCHLLDPDCHFCKWNLPIHKWKNLNERVDVSPNLPYLPLSFLIFSKGKLVGIPLEGSVSTRLPRVRAAGRRREDATHEALGMHEALIYIYKIYIYIYLFVCIYICWLFHF